MTEAELLKLIQGGENIHVEFKKSTTEITKDVYDTVCSFSNRDGGTIILGVKDNGGILGVAPDAVDRMKKDFVTSINNGQKINPPLYLRPETCTVNGRTLLVIQVPSGSQVCRHHGRIFDRSHEADIDITDNSDMVYQLYARKSGSYFVNKVTRFQMEDLCPDLIERARAMTASRTANHPWKSLSDEELLRSAGLILKDPERQLEGITLAAILLFGKDSTILSVLPQHKTDAIFRVENVDRYDDRDVIITNLLDTYDRMIAFGQKHLWPRLRWKRSGRRTPPKSPPKSPPKLQSWHFAKSRDPKRKSWNIVDIKMQRTLHSSTFVPCWKAGSFK